MCQISVVLQQEGKEELVEENVTRLEVEKDGISITTLFAGPRKLSNTVIEHIDFTAGKVVLHSFP